MIIEQHPFNDTFGLSSITGKTTKLILGTFPAHQVTSKDTPRLDFYYGSTDNRFWDLFNEVLSNSSVLSVENIINFLTENNFGIIDIIRRCYRRDNNSSSDDDLSIIEFQDIVDLLFKSNIDTIYTTSNFVTKLIKQQIEPLLNKISLTEKGKKLKKHEIFVPVKLANFEFIEVDLPSSTFNSDRRLKIKTLYSPSDQGLRGISKGINSKELNTDPLTHRLEQYRQFLA